MATNENSLYVKKYIFDLKVVIWIIMKYSDTFKLMTMK